MLHHFKSTFDNQSKNVIAKMNGQKLSEFFSDLIVSIVFGSSKLYCRIDNDISFDKNKTIIKILFLNYFLQYFSLQEMIIAEIKCFLFLRHCNKQKKLNTKKSGQKESRKFVIPWFYDHFKTNKKFNFFQSFDNWKINAEKKLSVKLTIRSWINRSQ